MQVHNRHSSLCPRRSMTFAVGLALSITVGAASAESPSASLCSGVDKPIFTCAIGHKLVSICRTGDKATYFFGTPGKIEMSSQDLFNASTGFSGGGEDQVYFRNKSYSYIVYSKTVRTSFTPDQGNDPKFTSGLVVQKDGKTISEKECSSDAEFSDDAGKIIPSGPYIEH